MKKFNLSIFVALLFAALLFTSCGLSKMMKKYETVQYSVEPKVLETHGGKIKVTFKGTIPEKYFHPAATVELTPVLKYEGGEKAFNPIKLRGESTTGDGTVIPKTGGSFTQEDEIEYTPEMNKAEVMLTAKAVLKNKTVTLGSDQGKKIGDGVIYTSTRVCKDELLMTAEHGYLKETFTTKTANVYFPYNKANLDWNLRMNKDEAQKTKLDEFNAFIAKNYKTKHFKINAWASPEGEENLNQKLSDDRGKAANNYVTGIYQKIYNGIKKADKTYDVKFEDFKPVFEITARGEDWDGFETAVEGSELKDKDAILNVVRSQPDRNKRQQEIRNMTVIYEEVEKLLEGLRRAELEVKCYDPKLTDEQIAEFSTSKPDTLSNAELLYAATLTEDKNMKLNIYKSATTVYPEDWRGYNNAGWILLLMGNAEEAGTFLEKANTLLPNNKIVLNNLGVVASWKGNYDEALTYFEQANANYNSGIIYIRKGQYSEALSKMSSTSCKYNLGLAQILGGNTADASATLSCAPQTAETFYLMAVLGARTKNTDMMYDNLKKAISADSKYKAQAKDDREFLEYMNVGDFQDIVK